MMLKAPMKAVARRVRTSVTEWLQSMNREQRRAVGFRGKLYNQDPVFVPRYVRRHYAAVVSGVTTRRVRKQTARVERAIAKRGLG